MPLYKTISPNNSTKIFVWKITEPLNELKSIYLAPSSLKRVNGMHSEIHQRGFVSVRHLLNQAGYNDDDLYYTEDGKPHLKDGKHISITHSFIFSAIIVSDFEVGIDIEKNRDKIKRIAPKFVGQENEFLTDEFLVKKLTVIWGAKESLFKIHPDGGLLFKQHLPIEAFNLKDKQTIGWIKKEGTVEKYHIFFEQIENFTLVYSLPYN